MNKKKLIFGNVLLTIIALSILFFLSCSKEELKISKTEKVYDESINAYVPQSFYDYDYILVKELPDPSTLLNSGRKSGDLPQAGLDGRIVDAYQIPFNSGAGSYEVSKTLPSGYVVTGIATMINSAKNYASLMLEYRYINSNGTMSPRYRVWDTDRAIIQPASMEAWLAVPTNSLITGFGIRGTSDVDYMTIFYRNLDPVTIRLTGSEYSSSGGLHPGGSYDKIYKPEQNGLDMDRAVLLGIGLMASSEGSTTRMVVNVGYLQ